MNSIRAIRKAKGITAMKLCRLAGLTPTMLLRIERGERDMSEAERARVAKALGVDLDAVT